MKILKILIILFNALTSIMHILFQIYLLSFVNIGAYTKFLLTENILIALVFFLMCTALIHSKFSIINIRYDTVMWLFFAGCVTILKPEHTTLDMINFTFPFKQWIILLGIALTATATNVIYLQLYKIRKTNTKS